MNTSNLKKRGGVMSNVNLPPLQVKVSGSYLGIDDPYEEGTLISVRALSNQAFQFSVLLESGALYTGIPINALCGKEASCSLTLSEAQMYDNIDEKIEAITLETLRYMPCTIRTNTSRIVSGIYLFSLCFVGNALSRHPSQWKDFMVISTKEGFLAYPQYRIRFMDNALCPSLGKNMNYKYNETIHLCEN
jgi:hypothetical protein